MVFGVGNGIGLETLGVEWILDDDGEFRVKELARLVEEKMLHTDSGGQETIWNKLVPKKVNIFVWRALKERLLVRVELDRRDIDLDSRSLYGLKQAPRAWFQHFAGHATRADLLLSPAITDSLHNDFDMTDLGKYALQLLERAHMVNCNPSQTPVDTESKLDLSYAVQRICLYMHNLREPHFAALKRILRYVQGTVDFGLQ
ncbi:ribonuclease H-like domain-containing protein, partial [Tanacetum coccineum]